MTTATFIVRSYCLFVALVATFIFSLGLSAVVFPRPYMPGDQIIGLYTMGWTLPIAIIGWWNALWFKEKTP